MSLSQRYRPRFVVLLRVVGTTTRRIVRWTEKALLWLVVILLLLAILGAIYQAMATERAERAHPPPGEIVNAGGHELHIRCVGQGSPTVVLEAALGNLSAHWVRGQQEVSDSTRVCAYDRTELVCKLSCDHSLARPLVRRIRSFAKVQKASHTAPSYEVTRLRVVTTGTDLMILKTKPDTGYAHVSSCDHVTANIDRRALSTPKI